MVEIKGGCPPDLLDRMFVTWEALEVELEAAEMEDNWLEAHQINNEIDSLKNKCKEIESTLGVYYSHRPLNGYPYVSTAYGEYTEEMSHRILRKEQIERYARFHLG